MSSIAHFGNTLAPGLPAFMRSQGNAPLTTGVKDANAASGYASSSMNARGVAKATNGTLKALARALQVYEKTVESGAYGQNGKFAVAEINIIEQFEGNLQPGQCLFLAVNLDPTATDRVYGCINGNQLPDPSFFKSSWVIFFALMGYYMSINEFANAFAIMADKTRSDDERLIAAMVCADIMYYTTCAKNAAVSVQMEDCYNINQLTIQKAQSSKFAPDEYDGTFKVFSANGRSSGVGKAKARTKVVKGKEFNRKYELVSASELTEAERALVPVLDDRYIISEKVDEMCRMVKWAIDEKMPVNFNNILLRSAPGYGKSTIYVIMAAAFGLPLHTLALNAMSEPMDLIGSFVPVQGDSKSMVNARALLSDMDIPDAIDICQDPIGCYKEITGADKPDATEADCMSAIIALADERAKTNNKTGKTEIKFVPGLIPAMSRPCMIGLDEISMPMNAGVVPTLHPLMDDTNSYTLPTGEVVTRHPLTIMVGTTNIGLEGNRAINQAYQDRNGLIVDLEEPSKAEMRARLIANTGFSQKKYPDLKLDDFLRCYEGLRKVARDFRLTDGTIGPRKLADWLLASMFCGSPRKAAEMTIIPGGTTDPRGQEELRHKVEEIFRM